MFKATGKTVLIALVAGLAACNDGAVAPHNQSAQAANVSGGGALATLTMTDTVNFTFVIDPSVSSSVYLGAGNSVSFPAGSLCDPSSSYGTSEWDNSCTPATSPVTVSASAWLESSSHARVDFATHLRFVPSSNPANWVTISFTDTTAAQDPTSDILYCATSYSACVSELSGDSTLVTVKNTNTGRVTRRIKHFSGYNVITGQPCEGYELNPDCVEGGNGYNRIGHGVKLPSLNTASASIGPKGGVLRLPSAGLTVVVPAGALSKVTTLSVSPRAGNALGYDFQPHGTQFAVALRVTQDLSSMSLSSASLSGLRAVYIADDSQLNDAAGLVTASEVMPVNVDRGLNQVSFAIRHFSTYLFATGDGCETSNTNPECSGANATRVGNKGASVISSRLQTVNRVGTTGARIAK